MSFISIILMALKLFFELWGLLREIKSLSRKVYPKGATTAMAGTLQEALDEYKKTHDKSKLIALRDKLKHAARPVV